MALLISVHCSVNLRLYTQTWAIADESNENRNLGQFSRLGSHGSNENVFNFDKVLYFLEVSFNIFMCKTN